MEEFVDRFAVKRVVGRLDWALVAGSHFVGLGSLANWAVAKLAAGGYLQVVVDDIGELVAL